MRLPGWLQNALHGTSFRQHETRRGEFVELFLSRLEDRRVLNAAPVADTDEAAESVEDLGTIQIDTELSTQADDGDATYLVKNDTTAAHRADQALEKAAGFAASLQADLQAALAAPAQPAESTAPAEVTTDITTDLEVSQEVEDATADFLISVDTASSQADPSAGEQASPEQQSTNSLTSDVTTEVSGPETTPDADSSPESDTSSADTSSLQTDLTTAPQEAPEEATAASENGSESTGDSTPGETTTDSNSQESASPAAESTTASTQIALQTEADSTASADQAATGHEVIFVDYRVSDWQSLVGQVDADTKVIILEAGRDGVDQIADALEGRDDISAVHIVSHGASGRVYLGSTILSGDNLASYASAWETVGGALTDNADILFYGCNVAEGAAGAAFLGGLSRATGADTAGSTDSTGNAAYGGDWQLEAATGSIEAGLVGTTESRAGYAGLLAPLEVNTELDIVDGGDAFLSLREAIILANSNGEADIITFAVGITQITLSIGTSGEDAAAGGDLDILNDFLDPGADLTIDGGTSGVSIDANSIDRVFDIQTGATVVMTNLLITGGDTNTDGGGIRVNSGADLTLENSTVSQNTSQDFGGGISVSVGHLTLTDSLIRNNQAAFDGGGVHFEGGTGTISGSRITGNTAFAGGGLLVDDSQVELTGSLVDDNTATTIDGGGINVEGTTSELTMINSTISGNRAEDATFGGGGGLYVLEGTVNLTHVTIADNTSNIGSGALDNFGGTVNATNTLITNNTSGNVAGLGINGTNTTNVTTDIGTSLADLADNGGPTVGTTLGSGANQAVVQSHLVDPGETTVVDAGTDLSGTVDFDQRGIARSQGAGYDIGAVEVIPPTTAITFAGTTLTLTDSGDTSVNDNLTLSFDDGTNVLTITDANGTLDFSAIAGAGVSGDASSVSIDLVLFAGTIDEIQVNGNGGDDSLNIDFSAGDFLAANGITLSYAGGDTDETATGDSITVSGGTFTSLTYNITGDGAGNFLFDGTQSIQFVGLEPATVTSVAGTVTINIDDGNLTADEALATVITDGGDATDGMLFLDAPGLAEDLLFAAPTVELIINGDVDDADTITIDSVDDGNGNANDFRAAVTINGRHGAGQTATVLDTVNINTSLTLGSAVSGNTGNLTVDADTIVFGNGAVVDTTAATANAGTGGVGDVNLTAGRNILLGTTTAITTLNGEINLVANRREFTVSETDAADEDTITIVAADGSELVLEFNEGGGLTDAGHIEVDLTTVNNDAELAAAIAAAINAQAGFSAVHEAGTSRFQVVLAREVEVTVNNAAAVVEQAGASGTFIGIELNNADLTTGDATVGSHTNGGGQITLDGRGGSTGNGNHGVQLNNAATISSTSTDDTSLGRVAAGITIVGTGGAGEDNNIGLQLINTSTLVTSVDGDIVLSGTGGSNETSGSSNNYGVYALSGADVRSTGTDSATGTAALITIVGTGGGGEDGNYGVYLNSSGTEVTSVDGDISITGTGGSYGLAGSNSNLGVLVQGGADIRSTGTDSVNGTAAQITIEGTGGAGDSSNTGVFLSSPGTQVTSLDGDISITGTGQGSGSDNTGVQIASGATVISLVAGQATITVTGSGAASADGVLLNSNTNAALVSDTTAITVNALAGDLNMTGDARIESNSGTIELTSVDDVHLGAVNADIDDTGAAGNVLVTADSDNDDTGAITDALSTEDANITAASAALRAGSGIGTDAVDINTATANSGTFTLAASTGTGAVNISNAGSFTIGTVDLLSGVVNLDADDDNSGSDNITLTAASPLIVNDAIVNLDGGNVDLNAAGDTVTINARVATLGNTGEIDINADVVELNVAGRGTVTVDSNDIDDLAALQTDGGNINLTDTADVVVQASTVLDTQFAVDGDAGNVLFAGAGTLSADAANLSLEIDVRGGTDSGEGGDLDIATDIADAGTGGSFLGAFLARTSGTGTISLNADITTDNTATDQTAGTPTPATTSGVTLEGRVEVSGSRTIQTEDGSENNDAGDVDLSAAQLFAAAAGDDLTIDTSTADGNDAGDVLLGQFDNDATAASFLHELDIIADNGGGAGTAGVLVLNGDIQLDDDTATASLFTYNGGSVVLSASATLDTEQGNDFDGGAVNFGSANISASAAGFDLAIVTSTTQATDDAGAITIGSVTSADPRGLGGQFVNDLTLDARQANGTTGLDGIITTGSQIFTDDIGTGFGAETGDVTIAGDWRLTESTLIDTNQPMTFTSSQGQDGFVDESHGGNVILTFATISATSADVDLSIDTSVATVGNTPNLNGGTVQFGVFNDTGGTGEFVRNITLDASGGGSLGEAGDLRFHGDVEISGTFDSTAAHTTFLVDTGGANGANTSQLDDNSSLTAGEVFLRATGRRSGQRAGAFNNPVSLYGGSDPTLDPAGGNSRADLIMEDSGDDADQTFIRSTTGNIVLEANDDIFLTVIDSAATAIITADADVATATGNNATGGAIIDNSADETNANVTATSVALRAGDGIGGTAADADIDIEVTTLAFVNATSGEVVITDVADGLIIDDVDGITTSSNVNGGGTIAAASPMTVIHNTTYGGNTTLTAGNDSGTAGDDFTIRDGAIITLDSDTDATLTINAGDNIVFGSTDPTTGQIVTQGDGTHTVQLLADREDNDDDSAGGSVTQVDDTFTAVTTDNLEIEARTGVGSSSTPLETAVADLDITNTTDGGIFIAETDAVSIRQIDQQGADDVTTVTAGGTITVTGDGTGGNNIGITASSGTVTLTATGTSSDVVLQDEIVTVGGNVVIDAGNDVTSTVDGTITTTAAADSGVASGSVTIHSAQDTSGNIDLDGSIDTSGADSSTGTASAGGLVTLDADDNSGGSVSAANILTSGGTGTAGQDGGAAGDINVNSTTAVTLNGTWTALGGAGTTPGTDGLVTIDSTGGGVLDGTDPSEDPNIIAGSLDITVEGDIGATGTGDIDVRLSGTASLIATGSDIYMSSDEDLTIDVLTTEAAQADTIEISTTGTANLTIDGSYTAIDTDEVTFSTFEGTLTIQNNALSVGTLNLIAGDSGTGGLTATANLATTDTSTGLTVDVEGASSISGVISGDGDLTKQGSAVLGLSGTNTYGGSTSVEAGTLQNEAFAVLPDGTTVDVASGATWNLNGFSETIAGLTGDGTVTNADTTGTLSIVTVGFGDATSTFDGVLQDNDTDSSVLNLTKLGDGVFTLTGDSTYDGTTTVNGGTLIVDGTLDTGETSSATVEVNTGATLGGSGTINNVVNINDGGTLSPGNSDIDTLSSESITFDAGSTFEVEIIDVNASGATAGTDYDQQDVTGTVDIVTSGDGSTLDLATTGSTDIAAGDEYIIILNDDSDSVTGFFSALVLNGSNVDLGDGELNEGDILSTDFAGSGFIARITYQGGDGNDVAILVDGPISVTNDGITVVDRVDGTDSIRILTAVNNATNLADALDGDFSNFTVVNTRPIGSINTDGILITGGAGDDILIIDLDGFNDGTVGAANFTGTISFNGLGQGTEGDSLYLNDPTLATTYASVIHTFTDADSGTVDIDRDGAGGTFETFTVSYDGLEPITQTITATDVTLNYNNSANEIDITDSGTAGQTTVTAVGTAESLTLINPTAQLTINAGGGNDRILVNGTGSGFVASLAIDGGLGTDSIELLTSLTLGSATSDGSVHFVAETIGLAGNINTTAASTGNPEEGDITLNAGTTITVFANATVQTAEGDVRFTAGQNILMHSGSAITTLNGDIALVANRRVFAATEVSVVDEDTLTITNAAGDTLVIEFDNDATQEVPGSVVLDMTGLTTDELLAAAIVDLINLQAGFGAVLQAGTNQFEVELAREVLASNTVALTEQAGAGGSFVAIRLNEAQLTTGDASAGSHTNGGGEITLDGRGGGTGFDNVGVRLDGGSVISSLSTDDSGEPRVAAGITILGTGGAGTGDNYGVYLTDADTEVTSSDGDILITGQGGSNGASGSNNNLGVYVTSGAAITSTGIDSATGTAAAIAINGTGGAGAYFNTGVSLDGTDTEVTSVDGDISITGTGGTNETPGASGNNGVEIDNATVSSTGTGDDAATITISGTGAATNISHTGVVIRNEDALVTSVDGDINITGEAGSLVVVAGDNNLGVLIEAGATISSTGADSASNTAATITIEGTGGAGRHFNYGVWIDGAGTEVTSADGDISITGQGGSAGTAESNGNQGVAVGSGAVISSTGMDSADGTAALITIHGTGGAGDNRNFGVSILSTDTEVTSVDGDISITGIGGADLDTDAGGPDVANGGDDNTGVLISLNAVISSTGVDVPGDRRTAAEITIHGTGGAGADSNLGVDINSISTEVTSIDGDISITGVGGSNGTADSYNNYGINLSIGAKVRSTGTDTATTDAATITIDATGGAGQSQNMGLWMQGDGTEITSIDGDISITGQGGSNGTALSSTNYGVFVFGRSAIRSNGTDSATGTAALITIEGTGGAGENSNQGVNIASPGTEVTSVDGDISITGVGQGSGAVNTGVQVSGGATVESLATGEATITVNGTGAAGADGVQLDGTIAVLASDTAEITVNALAGDLNMTDDARIETNSGTVRLNSVDDIHLGTVDADAGDNDTSATVFVTADSDDDGVGAITDNLSTEDANIIAESAALRAGSGIGVGAPGEVGADDINTETLTGGTFTLAAVTVSGDIHVRNDGSLTIGTVAAATADELIGATITDDVNAPFTGSHTENSGNDDISLIAASPEIIDAPVINRDGGDINLTALTDGDVTINADVQVTSEAVAGLDGSITVTAEGGSIVHNTNTVSTVGGSTTAGDGTITYYAEETLRIGDDTADNTRAIVRTVGGNIDMDATPSATVTVNGTGILFDDDDVNLSDPDDAANQNVLVETVTGNITIDGTGISESDNGFRSGVQIQSGTVIRSTGIESGSEIGSISITGTGGNGIQLNTGVAIADAGTFVTSNDGDIFITGAGGSVGDGSGGINIGVLIIEGAVVSSTGADTADRTAAGISIDGTGGEFGSSSPGVLLFGTGSLVTSIDGDISITGTGSNSGTDDNSGVGMIGEAVVSSTGTGDAAARITILGTGGGDGDDNAGILITDNGTQVASIDGDVTLVGVGAQTSSGSRHVGVQIRSSAQVDITGGADVIINGTAGANTDEGVQIDGGAIIGDTNAGDDATGNIILDANAGTLSLDEATIRTTAADGTTRRIILSSDTIVLADSLVQVLSAGTGQGEIVAAPDSGQTVEVELGSGADDSEGFALDETELNLLEAQVVRIGSADIFAPGNTPELTSDMAMPGVQRSLIRGFATENGETNLDQPFAFGTSTEIEVGAFTPDAEFATELFQLRTNGTDGTRTVSLRGDLDLATNSPSRHFEVYAGREIWQSGGVSVTTGTATGQDDKALVDLDVLDGDVHYRSGRMIRMSANASITTLDGEQTLAAFQPVFFASLADTADGDTITVTALDGTVLTFEFDSNSSLNDNSNIQIDLTGVTNNAQLAAAIAAAIDGEAGFSATQQENSSLLIIEPVASVDISGAAGLTDVVAEEATFLTDLVSVADEDTITLTAPDGTVRVFEFDNDSSLSDGSNVQIDLTGLTTDAQLAEAIVRAINGVDGFQAEHEVGSNEFAISPEIEVTVSNPAALTLEIAPIGNFMGIELSDADLLTGDAGNNVGGDILLLGRGGDTDSDNVGILIEGDSSITSDGTGPMAGTVTLVGIGGPGDDDNEGVHIQGADTEVTSVDGDITIVGTGGSNGTDDSDSNEGVLVALGAEVSSTGTGNDAATINILGRGARGESLNRGVVINREGTLVTSVDGDISVTGIGGTNGDASSSFNEGVQIANGAQVTSTGTDDEVAGNTAATITITGTGRGTSSNDGVNISGFAAGTPTTVTSVDGAIVITGVSEGTEIGNGGITIGGGAEVSSTGMDVVGERTAATITIDGTGSGTHSNEGVQISGTNGAGTSTTVTSIDGDISITGESTGTATGNRGVVIATGARITSTGTDDEVAGTTAATITIDGTGSGTSTGKGVHITGGAPGTLTTVESIDGDISITGQSTGTGSGNEGVEVSLGALVESTGTDVAGERTAAAITIDGTGSGTDDSEGVLITGTDGNGTSTTVTSLEGDISITGDSTASGNENAGVEVSDQASVTSTGMDADAAHITVTGTGGAGEDDNHGVLITDAGTNLTADTGNIQIVGTGGSNGTGTSERNTGVQIAASAVVETTTTDRDGGTQGTVNIVGTGAGPAVNDNHDVQIDGPDTHVRTLNGNVNVAGIAGDVVMSNAESSLGDPADNCGQISSVDGRITITAANDILLGVVNLHGGVFRSADVPQAFTDSTDVDGAIDAVSTIEIGSSLLITDLNVELTIEHGRVEDLAISLLAPDGTTRVDLVLAADLTGADLTGTVLDDEADTALTAGAAPFTGRFVPAGSLADFDGLDAQGTWTLEITDTAAGEDGALVDWALKLTGTAGPETGTFIADLGFADADAAQAAFATDTTAVDLQAAGTSNGTGAILDNRTGGISSTPDDHRPNVLGGPAVFIAGSGIGNIGDGSVGSEGRIQTEITNLEGQTDTGGIVIDNLGDLVIGGIDDGIDAGLVDNDPYGTDLPVALMTGTGNIEIATTSSLTVADPITNPGGGTTELTAIDANLELESLIETTGDISLMAGGALSVNSPGQTRVTGAGSQIRGEAGGLVTTDPLGGGDHSTHTSTTGIVSFVPVEQSGRNFATTQIDQLGRGTVTFDLGVLGVETNFSGVIDWGDGNTEVFNVNAGNFSFTHQYLANPNQNSAAPIDFTIFIANDPNVNFFDSRGNLNEFTFDLQFEVPGSGFGAIQVQPTTIIPELPDPGTITSSAVLDTTTVVSQSQNSEGGAGGSDEETDEERQIILRWLTVDGSRVIDEIALTEDQLNNLAPLLASLENGLYHVIIKEPGEERERIARRFIKVGDDIRDVGEDDPDQESREDGYQQSATHSDPDAEQAGIDRFWEMWADGRLTDREAEAGLTPVRLNMQESPENPSSPDKLDPQQQDNLDADQVPQEKAPRQSALSPAARGMLAAGVGLLATVRPGVYEARTDDQVARLATASTSRFSRLWRRGSGRKMK